MVIMSFPKIDGFVVTEKLGSGSYSTVYKAYSKTGARNIVAIKCIDKSRVRHSGTAIDNLITEIRLLKTLKHPYIVEMYDFNWDEKYIFIMMEYCNAGDLSMYIKRYGRLDERRVKLFLQQLVSALMFLREKGVAHMDLKPHNLLIQKTSDGKYTLKVSDFGFAQYMSSETRCNSVRGSPLYMAPEMIQSEVYDASVDLWSVGVILYECLYGRAPYSSTTLKELIDKLKAKQKIEFPAHSGVSRECVQLMQRLLQHEPADRLSYEELFRHPYIDLQHIPDRTNYMKAVNMIKHAIELDTRKEYEEAFQLYCESLRYLVPVVNSENDSVRRSALRAKVLRYMQRAEQLKMLLHPTSNKDMGRSLAVEPNDSASHEETTATRRNTESPSFDTGPSDVDIVNSRFVYDCDYLTDPVSLCANKLGEGSMNNYLEVSVSGEEIPHLENNDSSIMVEDESPAKVASSKHRGILTEAQERCTLQ